MFKVTTESGSEYMLKVGEHALEIFKGGEFIGHGLAIFPNRLKFLLAAETVKTANRITEGFNRRGVRVLKAELDKVLPGMILANRRGLRSTKILSVTHCF